MNRRTFLRTLIGAAVAAPLAPLAASEGYVWIRSLELADFGGFIPQGQWLVALDPRLTARDAAALSARYRWEAWLAGEMAKVST